MVGERGQFRVRASKGIHLVVPRDRIQSQSGLILRTATSVLFVIPWGRHWIIGTTDTDWSLDKAHPAASSSDIEYILEHVNQALAIPLTREDVEGVYAGLRPLLAGESETTSALSRTHVVGHPTPGLVVAAGGKYTTYRVMAADAVDEVARGLDGRVPASCTQRIPRSGPRVMTRRGTPAIAPRPVTASTWRGSSTCSGDMAPWPSRCSTCALPILFWQRRFRVPTTIWLPRSSMRPPTKVPVTWMMR